MPKGLDAEASFGEIPFSAALAVAKAVASHRTPKAAFGRESPGASRWRFEAPPRNQNPAGEGQTTLTGQPLDSGALEDVNGADGF